MCRLESGVQFVFLLIVMHVLVCADWAEDSGLGGRNGRACAAVGKQGAAVACIQGHW